MRIKYVPLLFTALLAITLPGASSAASSNSFYVETRDSLSQTGLTGPLPIPGLTFELPAQSSAYNTAIVTLNMPNLYLTHTSGAAEPMAGLALVVSPFGPDGTIQANGQIGCDTKGINTSARKPLTIVVEMPLGPDPQMVEAEWFSTSGDTIDTDTFASLSAVLVRK